ncbi:PREDICTED: 39S ribosomal protein L53, mitochondrial-like [Priapulus caudatus]|uniref:Large ribosomal subunit protein mL53 n=1 Tax=Priapulus caudatus TaxID=37621 RepID=A0ABM1E910_PRICU|nr:PREDICTED: 39S ribosomal protein L53, mitochondrial-like [Priapulus caudatus]
MVFKRSVSIAVSRRKAIEKLWHQCHLESVKKVIFSFDPFRPNVKSCRDVLSFVGSSRVQETNDKCRVQLQVKSDRSEPSVDLSFENGSRCVIKTENFTTVNLMEILNRVIAQNTLEKPNSLETASK